jgi:hypothetical protein
MIYSVVPRELEAELLPVLQARYADDPEVTVIVDRRFGERRRHRAESAEDRRQRVLRDRRRRRVAGEFASLAGQEAPAAIA